MYCAIEVQSCDENERRRIDLSCNNLHNPSRGATFTPYRRMLPPMFDANSNHRPSASGSPLPNARRLRTAIISDGRVEGKVFSHLVPDSAVFITAEITSVHDTVNYVQVTTTCCASGETDPRCIPIRVPEDDVHLRYSDVRCLNLTKVITYQALGCAPRTLPPERVNSVPPMLELSVIYGSEEWASRKGKEGAGGRLKVEMENGVIYQPGGGVLCFQNEPSLGETRCHDGPHEASNGLIGANIITQWFYRNHNRIARRLEALNPCWNDSRLFSEAREINIAMANQIWYYEFMASIIGFDYLYKRQAIFSTSGHIDDYDPRLEPRLSIEYVIGTRWFHSVQEGRLKTYDNRGRLLNQLNAVELSLRTGILPRNRTIQGLTQGMFRQPCAEADHVIDPDMSERILGKLQRVSDVASSDIMKGREAGLPPYTYYRKICGLPVPKDFDDLEGWMNQEQIDALKLNYEVVEDIDLMVAIYAEKRMKGALVGPTLACIMTDQLVWWRRADRFWYENNQHPGAFTTEQLREIREMTMSRLICDNGDDVDQIQSYAFFIPRPGNEIVDCKMIRSPNLDVWRDEQCQIDINNNIYQQQQQKLNQQLQQKIQDAINIRNNQPSVQALGYQQQLDNGWLNQQIINNQNNGLLGINNNQQIINNQLNNGNQQIVNNQNNGLIGINNNQQIANNQNGNQQITNNQPNPNLNSGNGNQQVANNQNNGVLGINVNQQVLGIQNNNQNGGNQQITNNQNIEVIGINDNQQNAQNTGSNINNIQQTANNQNNLNNQRLTNAIQSNNIIWGKWNPGYTQNIGWGPGILSNSIQGPGNQGAVPQNWNWQNIPAAGWPSISPNGNWQNMANVVWPNNLPNGPIGPGGWPNNMPPKGNFQNIPGGSQNNQTPNQNGNQQNAIQNSNQPKQNRQIVNNQNNGVVGLNINHQISNIQNNNQPNQTQSPGNQQIINNQNNGVLGLNINDQISNIQNNNQPNQNLNNGNQQIVNNQNNGVVGLNVNNQISNIQNNNQSNLNQNKQPTSSN